jgi:MFS family permease
MLIGTVVNSLGNGLVYPFLLIYLHEVRGFSLSVGGGVLALIAVTGIVVTPYVGSRVDQSGSRRQTALAVVALLVGYTLLPLAHTLAAVIPLALVIGFGQGAWWPANTALMSELTTQEERPHVFSLQRAAMNLGMGIGGILGGLVAVSSKPGTYTVLFLLNSATYAAFLLLLRGVPAPVRAGSAVATPAAGYRPVFANKFFVRLLLLDLAIGASFAFAFDVLPAHATGSLGLSNKTVGLLFLVNTVSVVVMQLPVSLLTRGRRRMRAYGLMGGLFAVGFLGVSVAATVGSALVVLSIAMLLFGLGECFLGPVRGALNAELAPAGLIGRYSALASGAFQIGMAGGRGIGGVVLDRSPTALWAIAGAVAVTSTICALTWERAMPADARLGPGQRVAVRDMTKGVGAQPRAAQ